MQTLDKRVEVVNMNAKYVAGKTGKMGAQTTGSAAVAGMVVVISQKAGFDLSVNEAVVIMGGLTVVCNAALKAFEKITAKK